MKPSDNENKSALLLVERRMGLSLFSPGSMNQAVPGSSSIILSAFLNPRLWQPHCLAVINRLDRSFASPPFERCAIF